MQFSETETWDAVVVGAGLSGLATALLLHEAGQSVIVLEAHAVAGGRVRSVFDANNIYMADLGPSWVWPAHQPVLSKWVEKLELSLFPQFDEGQAILDYGPEHTTKAAFIPGQNGNMRVVGGTHALVDAMTKHLPEGIVHTSSQVKTISSASDDIIITLENGARLKANSVIMALPPRIALETIDWQVELPRALRNGLDMMPTWMAPHAKVAVLYEKPFWRELGLSGRIASRAGPIAEAHDHCSADGSIAALWGFIGWPYDIRVKMGSELEVQVRLQLKRCFGEDSPSPMSVHIEEWSTNPFITSTNDLSGPMHHPSVGPDILRKSHFEGRIYFAGSETAERSPGLIEGAFDAAERVVGQVVK